MADRKPKADASEADGNSPSRPGERIEDLIDVQSVPTGPASSASGDAAAEYRPAGSEGSRQPPAGRLERLRAELEEAKDGALRALAELDNYRKRAARQIEEERRYAAVPLFRDLLPVLDNLKRTLKAGEKSHDAASLLDGVKLVLRQFYTALERHHCVPIEALHKPFDPNVHQAILQQPSREFPANTVLCETQAGFQLHDRVVRPSQVIVSTAAADPRTEESIQDGS